jgi:hypothetical protein
LCFSAAAGSGRINSVATGSVSALSHLGQNVLLKAWDFTFYGFDAHERFAHRFLRADFLSALSQCSIQDKES